MKLYPFQDEGVRFLTLDPKDPGFPIELDASGISLGKYHKLLADDMGLGKTIQVIGAMNAIDAHHTVIICPATVKIHWARKIAEWTNQPQSIFIIKTGKCEIPPGATVIIVNYELLLRDKIFKQLVARGQGKTFDAVVMDEAHYLKGLSTKRTRRILGKGSFLHSARYKWALTGTPVMNRPAELYPLLYSLAPECIAPHVSWDAYGTYFCNGHRDKKCRKCGANWKVEDDNCPRCGAKSASEYGFNTNGHSHTSELAERLRPFMLRRKKEDVLDQLPEKVESIIELDVPPPPGVETEPIATARRLLALAKITQTVKFVDDLMADVEKVVVFAYHRDVIEQLAEALGEYSPVIIYGGMTADQKQVSIDGFITNPSIRVVVAQLVAGGTGVDGLQGVCNHAVCVELDWSPGVMDQAIDRLRRIGQRDTVFVYYLSVPDSLDTQMDRTLEYKRHVINQIVKAKEVTKIMSQLAPEVQVALANAMQGISHAMQAIATAITGGSAAPAPAAEKPKTPPKGKPKAEPVPDPVTGAASAPPAAASAGVSEEDFRKAVGAFLATPGADREVSKAILNEQIWPKYGATALANLAPEHYPAALEDLKKGPAAYAGAPAGDDLSGI